LFLKSHFLSSAYHVYSHSHASASDSNFNYWRHKYLIDNDIDISDPLVGDLLLLPPQWIVVRWRRRRGSIAKYND